MSAGPIVAAGVAIFDLFLLRSVRSDGALIDVLTYLVIGGLALIWWGYGYGTSVPKLVGRIVRLGAWGLLLLPVALWGFFVYRIANSP